MKKLIYILMFLSFFTLKAQPPKMWINRFGAHGIDIGYGVKESFERKYIVVGSTSSFGTGAVDAYVILIDSMGQKIWEKTYGGVLTDVAKRVVVNPIDSGFIFTGYTNSIGFGGYDIYVVRLNKNGDVLWQRSFGGLDWDFSNDICLAPDGNVFICGFTYSLGYGKKDAFLIKVNSVTGDLMWQKNYGGSEDDEFRGLLSSNTSTNIVLVGETSSYDDLIGDIYFIKTDLNGDSIEYRSHGLPGKRDFANSVINNVYSNGYVLGGGTESYSTFGKDAFIFGIDTNGDSLWLEKYGNANVDQEALKVISNVSSTGTYVISYSEIDLPNFKRDVKNLILNDVGIYYSGHSFGGFEDEEFYDISNTSDKGYIAVGYTKSYGSAAQDLFIAKYDSSALYGGNLIGVIENSRTLSSNIEIFPTILNETNPNLLIKHEGEFHVTIYDLTGKLIHEPLLTYNSQTTISFKDTDQGVYFIRISSKDKITNFKVLKQN